MDRRDYFLWKDFRSKDGQQLTTEEFKLICELHAKYQKHTYYEPCTCSPKTIIQWIQHLNVKFNESKKYRVKNPKLSWK